MFAAVKDGFTRFFAKSPWGIKLIRRLGTPFFCPPSFFFDNSYLISKSTSVNLATHYYDSVNGPSEKMPRQRHLLFILSFAFVIQLSGCAGETSGSAANSIPQNTSPDNQQVGSDTIIRGQFIDAAVSGLTYRTESNGVISSEVKVTSATGEFEYSEGDVVHFYLGSDGEGLLLGSGTGNSLMTPISLVTGASNEDNQTVTNMIRLLQALDSDSNTSNGISISETVRTAANAPQSLDFAVSSSLFENTGHAMLRFLLSDDTAALVGTDQARAHLRSSIDSFNSSQ